MRQGAGVVPGRARWVRDTAGLAWCGQACCGRGSFLGRGLVGARAAGAACCAGLLGFGLGVGARGVGLARREHGQGAGGPEGDHVLQAIEQAGKGGQNQGMQSRDQACFGGLMIGGGTHFGRHDGDLMGQGGGRRF